MSRIVLITGASSGYGKATAKAFKDNGDTVKVTFAYNDPALVLILTRTGETQFTVTSSSDTTDIPVGTVFTYQP